MLMNRAMPRRQFSNPGAGGVSSPGQPESALTSLAPVEPDPDEGVTTPFDVGGLPMPPLPPPPPGSNAPLAEPGFQSQSAGLAAPGGRSMMGAPPPGMDQFGGGPGAGMGMGDDDALMKAILAGLPQGGRPPGR